MRSPGRARGGRQAEAARNDTRILEAARAVFVADPSAPIAAVARRAGVGIGALYRRYGGKEEMLRRLCGDGLKRYLAEAEAALSDEDDPWGAFCTFVERIVEADVASLTLSLAGTFMPTEELFADAERSQQLNVRIFDRLHAAGEVHPGVDVNDLALIIEQLAAVRVGDEGRTRALRRRYLRLFLDAIHTPSDAPLPGPPPTWEEIGRRWVPTRRGSGPSTTRSEPAPP